MRRAGVAALLVMSGATLVALLITASVDKRKLAFTLGVQPAQVVAVLGPGERACQKPIDVAAQADLARIAVRVRGRPRPELGVAVSEYRDGRALSGSVTRPAYGNGPAVAPLDVNGGRRVSEGLEAGRRVTVCVLNLGSRKLGYKVGLLGGPGQAARTSDLYVNGRRTNADMTLVFERTDGRSMLALLPDAVERAALFTAGWVSPAVLWILGAAFLFGLPLLLSLALRASAR